MDELALLYQALSHPVGLALHVSDFDLARARLYAARRKANDPALAQIRISAVPGQEHSLWLIHISLSEEANPSQEHSPSGKSSSEANGT